MLRAAAAGDDLTVTTACVTSKYGVEKSTALDRAGLIETWLMSKSNYFWTGA